METTSSVFTFLIPILLGGIFAVLGIGLLIFALRDRKKAKAAEAWPTVNGTIGTSRLDQNTRTERRDGRTYTHTSYAPVVEYTYEVGGKTYQGNHIFPGATLSYDLGTAQNIVNRYQPGSTATVHYDPGNPIEAVLEIKAKGGNIFMIIGVVFAIIGVIGCCIGVIIMFASQ
ncbi:MAG: DUF3592 domain-containing protein [Anaerolineales bacterium]|nr:DUF3592 domain-containing protein [Anaerolineales bacterium]